MWHQLLWQNTYCDSSKFKYHVYHTVKLSDIVTIGYCDTFLGGPNTVTISGKHCIASNCSTLPYPNAIRDRRREKGQEMEGEEERNEGVRKRDHPRYFFAWRVHKLTNYEGVNWTATATCLGNNEWFVFFGHGSWFFGMWAMGIQRVCFIGKLERVKSSCGEVFMSEPCTHFNNYGW